MKLVAIALGLIITVTIAGDRPALSQQKVTWHDYATGIKLARQYKRPLVVDFYADWCKWCKVMDEKTFSDPAVAAKLSRDYICVRVDTMSRSTIQFKKHRLGPQEFAQMLGVSGLPTVLFMDSNETIITRIPGFIDRDVFLPLLGYINDKCYLKNISFQDYKEGKIRCDK
jgi:thiol:disulfide interchange protein